MQSQYQIQNGKIHIQPNIHKGLTKKEQWLLKNRKTYGKELYVGKRLIPIFILNSIIMLIFQIFGILSIIKEEFGQLISNIVYLIPLLLIFCLWKIIPIFNDKYFIHNELKGIIIVFSFSLIFNVMITILYNIFSLSLYTKAVLYIFNVIMASVGIIYCQTYYIINKINKTKTNDDERQLVYNYFLSDSKIDENTNNLRNSNVNIAMQSLSTENFHQHLTLNDILKTKEYFNLFVLHLCQELSDESLIAYIEFTQFKQICKSDDNFQQYIKNINENENENENDNNLLSNSDIIPLSSIVYDNFKNEFGVRKYILIIRQLYNKYIIEDGEFPINISSRTRYKIKQWIDKHQMLELREYDISKEYSDIYLLLEPAREELFNLLRHSFQRFIMTDEFLDLVKI